MQKETFLIIDDKKKWQGRMKKIIEDLGYQALTANNHSKGLVTILESGSFSNKPPLTGCTVDLNLADDETEVNWDGLGLLHVCKNREIPSIVVSGYLSSQRENELYELGVFKCIDKGDFSEQILSLTIKDLISNQQSFSDKDLGHIINNKVLYDRLKTLDQEILEKYKEAFSLINVKQVKRVEFSGKDDPDSLALWERDLMALDNKYKKIVERLKNITSIKGLDACKIEVLKEAMGWRTDLT